MPRNKAGTPSKMDRFAELIAGTAGTEHDGDVPFVGAMLGMTPHQANACFQNLRAKIGSQAR